MNDNLDLRNLQKIILGKRKEPLSAIEIRNLFSYPTTAETVLYIITALNQEKLDPHTTLIQAIANATKKEDLVPISLALRYGADPNLYINTPSIGDIHILGYTYLMLSKQDLALLNSVVIMLSIFGANPQMLIFDSKGGVIKDEFSLVEPLKGQNVLDWLDDQGFDTIIPQIKNQNYSKVDKKFMTMIATFLDKEKLLVIDPRLDEVIGSHANIILNKHESKIDPNKGLKAAIKYLNLVAFEKFIDNGGVLKYSEINDLILAIKKYKNGGDVISMSQITQFLLYSVKNGQDLDLYQGNLLKNVDQNIYDTIIKEYNLPYWKKICLNNNSPISDRLKTLAYQLNLDPEVKKDILCMRIKNILQSDPELVKKLSIERQKARIQASASYINEFGNPLSCSNRSVLKGNIYDYPDSDIAFYRDDQDSLWCFTSNNFQKIIEQKKNPYTVQEFPLDFLNKVKSQTEFITKYRNIDQEPPLISETLNKIRLNDEITNNYTDRYFKLFKELMLLNNITEWNLDKLSEDDMEKILNEIGISVNLRELDKEHAVKTFSITSYNILIDDKNKIDNFVSQIEKYSTNKTKLL